MEKKSQKEIRIEKVINRKCDKLYVKWKDSDSSLNTWIDKKNIVSMREYSPEPESSGGRVKVELDLSNHATDLKTGTSADTS